MSSPSLLEFKRDLMKRLEQLRLSLISAQRAGNNGLISYLKTKQTLLNNSLKTTNDYLAGRTR
jgi:hypothetical protein